MTRRGTFELGAVCLVASLVVACSPAPRAPTADPAEPHPWVTVYQPHAAWNGYTLAFLAHRVPILLDMNGRIIHRWPEARVKSRIRLLPDGSLLGIALGRGVVEYDWDGNTTWEWASDKGFAHHDVIRLGNGSTVTLIRPDEDRFDDIVEVDRSGSVVWEWRSGDHLEPYVPAKGWRKVDVTHLNSIQELPDNSWFEQGDNRFRPGNLLVSSRELDMVFLIDRQTDEIVWTFNTDLDKQHEPLMIGPESAHAGGILIFNNRYRSFYGDRQSAVLEVEPTTGNITWQYRSVGFFSPTSGVEQPLPNGNVLITSSRGGRIFEIDRAGNVVWAWVPTFDTTRSHRYPYDYCPQLAALDQPVETPIEPADDFRHVDTDAFRFARRGLRQTVNIDGQKREVLKYSNDCRQMILPAVATAELGFGIDRQRLREIGETNYRATFALRVRRLVAEDAETVFEDAIDLEGPPWREVSANLQPYALQRVELCIVTEESGIGDHDPEASFAYWQQPRIQGRPAGGALATEEDLALDELTAEELETRKKHLEALGYIN